MNNTTEIKRVIRELYKFNFTNTTLSDGKEVVNAGAVNEFASALKLHDFDHGIIVSVSGYQKGLIYKATNNGEFYNNPNWLPDLVSFAFNVFGLKKDSFYRLSVVGRDTFNSITETTKDRNIQVINESREILINKDFSKIYENTKESVIFKANSNEANFYFTLGKVYLSDIILEEVELFTDINSDVDEQTTCELLQGKIQAAAFGVFTTQSTAADNYTGRYIPMMRLTGKGINLYFDSADNQYILERDNVNDILGESFTKINYLVDFNFNKLVNKGNFSQYNITEVSGDVSPNTLKQGYIKFQFVDDNGNAVQYTNKDGRLAFIISKIY